MSKEIDVKRFYVPDGIKADCTECGAKCTREYLSYPVVDEPFEQWFYCDECDTEFSKKAVLTVKLELE